jgi:hypothetical protein
MQVPERLLKEQESCYLFPNVGKRKGESFLLCVAFYELVPKNVSVFQVADTIAWGFPVGGLVISCRPAR